VPRRRSDTHLLARRVQDVKQAGLAVDHHLLPVAVLDGRVILVHKMVLDQLDGQGGLADTAGCGRMEGLETAPDGLVLTAHHHQLVLGHGPACLAGPLPPTGPGPAQVAVQLWSHTVPPTHARSHLQQRFSGHSRRDDHYFVAIQGW
jgi:hypothetical protein